MKLSAGELISGLIAILGVVSIYLKNKYSQKSKTPQENYEDDKKRIDEVIASGDVIANDVLLDDVLPPSGGTGDTGSGDKPK